MVFGSNVRLAFPMSGSILAPSVARSRRAIAQVVACALVLCGVSANLNAAVITAAGSHLSLGPAWRTTSVVKPLDIDLDNIYGTLGYMMFNTHTQASGSGVGQGAVLANTTTFLPSYITITANLAHISYQANYTLIDDPANPSGPDLWSGISYMSPAVSNSSNPLFNINFGAATPANTLFRLGVFVDNTGPLDGSPVALRVAGAGGDSLSVPKPQATQVNNYYFFTLAGVQAGNTLTVSATRQAGNGAVVLGGFTFDAIAVPEPSALSLASVASILVLGFGLHRRNVS